MGLFQIQKCDIIQPPFFLFQIQKCDIVQPPFFSNLAKVYSTVVCTML